MNIILCREKESNYITPEDVKTLTPKELIEIISNYYGVNNVKSIQIDGFNDINGVARFLYLYPNEMVLAEVKMDNCP